MNTLDIIRQEQQDAVRKARNDALDEAIRITRSFWADPKAEGSVRDGAEAAKYFIVAALEGMKATL